MFRATTKSPETFKKLFIQLGDLMPEITFDCEESGLTMQLMDPSYLVLTRLIIPASAFETYECSANASFSLKVSLLSKLLAHMSEADSMELTSCNSGESLSVIFALPSGPTLTFCLSCLTVTQDFLDVSTEDYPTYVLMGSQEFRRICDQLSTISDFVTVTIRDRTATFSASGISGFAKVTLVHNDGPCDDPGTVRIGTPSFYEAEFPLKMLCSIAKTSSLSDIVVASSGPDRPLKLSYTFLDSAATLSFFLSRTASR